MERDCFFCDFFYSATEITGDVEFFDDIEGECRRRPPIVGDYFEDIKGKKTNEHGFGEFPKVLGSDWCGEFVKRESSDGQ